MPHFHQPTGLRWTCVFACLPVMLIGCASTVTPSSELNPELTERQQEEELQCKRLSNEQLLKVALDNSYMTIADTAVRHMTDQAMLATVAIECKKSWLCEAALAKLTNQAALARVAAEAKEQSIRIDAVKKLTDQPALTKIAVEGRDPDVRRLAVSALAYQTVALADQTLLAKLALEDQDIFIRSAAVDRLTDQAALARVAVEGKAAPYDSFFNRSIRRNAVKKITDQYLLAKIAIEDRSVRDSFDRLTETIAEVAVANLTDPSLLAKVAREGWIMASRAAIAKMNDQTVLAELAMHDSDAAAKLTDQPTLANVALRGVNMHVRNAAVAKLTDQAALTRVVAEESEFEVRKAAFRKLSDRDQLGWLAEKAMDPALKLAARIRLEQTTWDQAFDDARRGGGKALGAFVHAAALVERPIASPALVVKACHEYIRQGDASRIPELCDLLVRYGDEELAEDYLNCGQETLAAAGRSWASGHGYSVRMGFGSHRVTWGSAKR